jgi:hypothetical protein
MSTSITRVLLITKKVTLSGDFYAVASAEGYIPVPSCKGFCEKT